MYLTELNHFQNSKNYFLYREIRGIIVYLTYKVISKFLIPSNIGNYYLMNTDLKLIIPDATSRVASAPAADVPIDIVVEVVQIPIPRRGAA